MQQLFEYDFGAFSVGTADHPSGDTGVTVLTFPHGAVAAVDPRGGAVMARGLEQLALTDPTGRIDALVLTGGGFAGLDAATGVHRGLLQDRPPGLGPPRVCAAAILERDPARAPDAELGRKALASVIPGRVPVGRTGAGAGAMVGAWFGLDHATPSGQGAGFFEWAGLKVFALSVVNALGNVLDERGDIVRGVARAGGGYEPVIEGLVSRLGRNVLSGAGGRKLPGPSLPPKGHSTLTAVVTNLQLERADLFRLAVMAQAAMARVIDPLAAPDDGDVTFAVSTLERPPPRDLRLGDLGVLAGRVVQQAVFAAVRS